MSVLNLVNHIVQIKFTLSEEMYDRIAPINSKNQLNIPIDLVNQFNDGGFPFKFDPNATYEDSKNTPAFRVLFFSLFEMANRGQSGKILPIEFNDFLKSGEAVNFDSSLPLKLGDKIKLFTNLFSSYESIAKMEVSEDLKTFIAFQEYKNITQVNMTPVNNTIIGKISIPEIIGGRTLQSILDDDIITDKVSYIRNSQHDNSLSMMEIKDCICVSCSDDAILYQGNDNLQIPVGSKALMTGVQLLMQNMFNIDLLEKTAEIIISKNNILGFEQ